MLLGSFDRRVRLSGPGKVILDEHTEECEVGASLHCSSLDVYGVVTPPLQLPEIHDHLLGFADVERQVVGSMRERKGRIEELADAFIALPGGLGTLEELFEIWVGRFLNFHQKPVIVLDPFGLYDPLKTLIDHLEVEGFVKPGQRELLHWCTTIDQALDMCDGR